MSFVKKNVFIPFKKKFDEMLNFSVTFNSKCNVFFPNTEVTATVILHAEKTIKARKIDIKIIGRARTDWTEVEYHNYYDHCHGEYRTRTEYIPYGSHITYISNYAILWASRDGSNLLPPGQYQFPVKFKIPSNAPPNMSGGYGSVSYFVKANIDIPWAFDEERYKEFSVCPLIDLNLDSRLALSVVTAATELERKCCSCTSYPLTMTVKLPKTGYVPGEKIKVNVELNNATTSVVTSIELAIKSTMVFTGDCQANVFHGYSYNRPQTLNKSSSEIVTSKKVEINSKDSTKGTYILHVPAMTPSFDDCPIILIRYSLFVKIHTDAVFSSGPYLKIPITIGTIPLRANNPPSATVLANANFTNVTFEHKSAESKDTEGPPAGYQAQVPFYTNLTPTQSNTSVNNTK